MFIWKNKMTEQLELNRMLYVTFSLIQVEKRKQQFSKLHQICWKVNTNFQLTQ